MAVPQKSFAQFVADMVAQWQANTGITVALQSGDPVLAMFQSLGSQLTFLQALVVLVNSIARAATSTGGDVDSFMADFGFTRLPPTFASGPATFAALAPVSSNTLLLPGTIIQTTGGAVQYQVIADPNQAAWSSGAGAYVMTAGQSSIIATVQALVAGTVDNVAATLLNQFSTPVPGFATVSNAAGILNGIDAESDIAFRARFVLYLNSLSKATQAAIQAAILGVQQGIFYALLENVQPSGAAQLGEFVAVIDDGSGSPPGGLIANVQTALNNVRAFTVQAVAIAPTKITPAIVLTIHVAVGFTGSVVQAAVQAAIVALINASSIGGTLYISAIEAAALAVAGVAAVQGGGNTTINASTSDLALTSKQVARIAAINVTVNTY